MAAFAPSEVLSAYAASKQAVLGLTESLRLELDGTTVAVSVLCPGAVDTEIAQSERNRQPRYGRASGRAISSTTELEKAAAQLIDPDEAGRRVLAGIENDEFWLFTHPSWARRITTRFDEAAAAADRTREALGDD
jgi:short-subunit dehydrogenase